MRVGPEFKLRWHDAIAVHDMDAAKNCRALAVARASTPDLHVGLPSAETKQVEHGAPDSPLFRSLASDSVDRPSQSAIGGSRMRGSLDRRAALNFGGAITGRPEIPPLSLTTSAHEI